MPHSYQFARSGELLLGGWARFALGAAPELRDGSDGRVERSIGQPRQLDCARQTGQQVCTDRLRPLTGRATQARGLAIRAPIRQDLLKLFDARKNGIRSTRCRRFVVCVQYYARFAAHRVVRVGVALGQRGRVTPHRQP